MEDAWRIAISGVGGGSAHDTAVSKGPGRNAMWLTSVPQNPLRMLLAGTPFLAMLLLSQQQQQQLEPKPRPLL